MNEVREVSTSDIKNSEKVHMGDEEETGLTQGDNVRADDPGFFRRSYRGERSPPRRALGAAGEGEDREDSPGQGADSPPLGNLPPREQSADERKGGEQEKKVGRAGQWRQTAAALRAPWRRPRREEPSRLCWLVSTTTHALCILRLKSPSRGCSGAGRGSGTDTIGPVGGRGGRRSEKGRKRPGPACPCRWR